MAMSMVPMLPLTTLIEWPRRLSWITKADSEWAIAKATAALDGVKALLSATPPERFS
jgi:hypothetical protein